MRTTITPKIAINMLSRNTNNRRPSAKRIQTLSNDMRQGGWVYNGEPIIVDDQEQLLDGQHRLLACIHSGRNFETELITGITDARAFSTIDTGKARSGSDVLSIRGCKTAPKLAAVLKIINEYCMSVASQKSILDLTRARYSNAKILILFEKYDTANYVCERLRSRKFPSAVIAGFWIVHSINPMLADSAIKLLNDGLFQSTECPIKKLYDMCLSKPKNSRTGVVMTQQVALTIKALNAYEDGKKVKVLRWQIGERFPIPNNLFPLFPEKYLDFSQ